VKLMWFHLMPYTEWPADVRDANPSVCVEIHSTLFDPKRAHLMYRDFTDELEYAAEPGFDAICVNEHHTNGYGLLPSPDLIASALARRMTDTPIPRGPRKPPSRSTAVSPSRAMSTSGPARCRSLTRRTQWLAAAWSKPGSGPQSMDTAQRAYIPKLAAGQT